MKIGYMNDPKLDVLDEVDWMVGKGFRVLDLTIEPPGAYDLDLRSVKERIERYKLSVIGHTQPGFPFTHPSESIRKGCLEEFKILAGIFKSLGASYMAVHPNYSYYASVEEYIVSRNIDFLKRLIPVTQEIGVGVMFENFTHPFDTPDAFQRIIGEVPEVKILLDVGHLFMGHEDDYLTHLATFFSIFRSEIVHLHLSDNWGKLDDHLPLGCGLIDWGKVMDVVQKNYMGSVTLEVFTHDRDYLILSKRKLEGWIEERE